MLDPLFSLPPQLGGRQRWFRRQRLQRLRHLPRLQPRRPWRLWRLWRLWWLWWLRVRWLQWLQHLWLWLPARRLQLWWQPACWWAPCQLQERVGGWASWTAGRWVGEETYTLIMIHCLVVWNMFFRSVGNNNPNWLSYFSEGLKPPTSTG